MEFQRCHEGCRQCVLVERNFCLFALFFSPSVFVSNCLRSFNELPSCFCFQAAKQEGEKLLPFYNSVVMFYKQMLGKVKIL